MHIATLARSSLRYYWRTNLAVVAGVATAVAVLAGALLVGGSVQASLRDLVERRLGATDYVISADHFFREELAAEVAGSVPGATTCPLVHLEGVVTHEASGLRAYRVEIFGVDERFGLFHHLQPLAAPRGREALVGEPLARELHASPGDTLLVRLQDQAQVPMESLFGRRGDEGRTLRVSCAGVLPVQNLGDFSLRPGRQTVLSIFVPLTTLRKGFAQTSGINTILVSDAGAGPNTIDLATALRSRWNLTDAGVRLRLAPAENAANLESPAVLLGDTTVNAALQAARDGRIPASAVYTYLANTIRSGAHQIPYSVIAAADLGMGAFAQVRASQVSSKGKTPESGDPLWLNQWAAHELKPAPGSAIDISYFIWSGQGRLETASARFRFAGVVDTNPAVGPSLAPEFPGITEAASMGAWDPPFTIDMSRIRPQDEKYWDLYRTTPKAFIRLERGRELWGTRFGALTSVRLAPRQGVSLEQTAASFGTSLLSSLRPELSGFEIRNARETGLAAARGSTDFGEYFVYFSFFLIVAAVLLAALFFRLGVEQRVREVGTLLAEGYTNAQVSRIFILEGSVLAACGTVIGLPLAVAYAAVLMHGLRTWWIGASGTTELHVHISWLPLALGAAAGLAAASVATAVAVRSLQRASARALLSGTIERKENRTRTSTQPIGALATLTSAGAVMAAARLGVISEAGGFFGAGVLLLLSALWATSVYFRRATPAAAVRPGVAGLLVLGIRNAGYSPGRSLSCIALIACATFVIVSLEAFRTNPELESLDRNSGTGGFALQAETALPLAVDLNSSSALEDLGFSETDVKKLASSRFVPFRLKPGDDTSCLTLYAPQEPRILGVPAELIGSGRFSFSASVHGQPDRWHLLDSQLEDGAVAAITDANTAEFVLHKSLGEDVTVHAGDGNPVKLRLVATVRRSIFQSGLLISERNFVRLFPNLQGFRFFLLDVPHEKQAEIAQLLEERLSDWGFDARATADELASFHQVENTYLSTFQSLGGLGLILGTMGLAAVLLRNVLERRKELALLQAIGFPGTALAGTVVVENAALVIFGLMCGTVCALLAISPALLNHTQSVPRGRLALLAGLVLATGLCASLLAVAAAFRSPLLPALRSE